MGRGGNPMWFPTPPSQLAIQSSVQFEMCMKKGSVLCSLGREHFLFSCLQKSRFKQVADVCNHKVVVFCVACDGYRVDSHVILSTFSDRVDLELLGVI